MESCTVIAEVIAAVGAAVAGITALISVNSWRRQLRSKVEFDAARRALLAALRVRDEIRAFRNPLHWIQEIGAAGAKDSSGYERELYSRRYRSVAEAGQELRAAELEGEVLWGQEYLNRLEPLTDCVRDLGFAYDDYFRRPDGELAARAEAIVKGEPGDDFERRVLEAVDEMERFLRPKLGAKR